MTTLAPAQTLFGDISLEPEGDSAILIRLGEEASDETAWRVHVLARAIRDAMLPGVCDIIPAYASVMVCLDPLRTSPGSLASRLAKLVSRLDDENAFPGRDVQAGPAIEDAESSEARRARYQRLNQCARVFEIPVLYGGSRGPDLPYVARHAGMSEEEVIRIHSSGSYPIAMIGFLPGFPYLRGLDPAIACPRMEKPRLSVAAGSVGIAGGQTGVYPIASPGGWRIIGRTPAALYDPRRDVPVAFAPGDLIRFRAIDQSRFDELALRVLAGDDVIVRLDS